MANWVPMIEMGTVADSMESKTNGNWEWAIDMSQVQGVSESDVPY